MNFHSSVWIHHIFMNEFYGNFSYKSNIDLKKNIYYEKQRIPRRDQFKAYGERSVSIRVVWTSVSVLKESEDTLFCLDTIMRWTS
jgi:hypothetical protein